MPLMQVIGDVMSATRMGPLHDPVFNPDPALCRMPRRVDRANTAGLFEPEGSAVVQ